MKQTTKTLRYLTWLCALGLAAWILSKLPLSGFQQAIAGVQPVEWIAWIILNLLILGLLAGRWLVITRAMGLPIRFLQILGIRQAGHLVSFVTPGPQFGGEPLQVYWLWRRYAIPGPAAFLAVGLDRFYEFWVNFGVLLIAVLALIASATADSVEWLTIAAVLLGLMLLMALSGWLVVRQPARLRDLVRRLSGSWQLSPRLSKLDTHWSAMSDLLQQLVSGHRTALGRSLALSLLAWLGMLLEFWFLLYLVQAPRDLASFVFLFTVVRLAFLLPLPGGIGSVEAAVFWAFQSMNTPLATAAGLIVLLRLRDIVVLASGAMVLPALNTGEAS